MNEIIKILMERDEMTEEEAKDLFNETWELINEALENDNVEEIEDIMISYLGLEMDYIDRII